MPHSKIDLLTHPLRARIILAIAGRTLTTQQIATLLPDIPRASLYRHIGDLAEGGILQVVDEKRIRGTLEKTFAIPSEATILTPEDMESVNHEEYLRLVTSFLGAMVQIYQTYLAKAEAGLQREAFARGIPLFLTAEELQSLKNGFLELIKPLEANEPTPERRRRIVGILGVPDQPDPLLSNSE